MEARAELKKIVSECIERHADELIAFGEDIRLHPELGYRETRTAAAIAGVFRSLKLPTRENLALTGVRANIQFTRPGPVVALLGELDALAMPGHPAASPENGAAHACGHNGQIAMLAGAAAALSEPALRGALAGSVALIACPAEEGCPVLPPGIAYSGGKQELVRCGVFDDVDLVLMTHADECHRFADECSGFVYKDVTFFGKTAHCGNAPWDGVNAQSAARLALDALDAQRDLFPDDYVRVHGLLHSGDGASNVVPEKTDLSYMIRAKTPESLRKVSLLFDRAMRAGAVAFGAKVKITTRPGYMPMQKDSQMEKIHRCNVEALYPGEKLIRVPYSAGASDIGDISQLKPTFMANSGGWRGKFHSADFQVADLHAAYVMPAKLMVFDVIDLLCDGAAAANGIARKKTPYTKEQYLAMLDSFNVGVEFEG